MKAAILTSPNQWFEPYAHQLSCKFGNAMVFTDHNEIDQPYDALFILGYHRIIEPTRLSQNRFNLVVHESYLPKGKGWSPLFWQVLEGKNEVVFTMFNAASGIDDGDVVMTRTLRLDGLELNAELRNKQAMLTLKMCQEFYRDPESFLPLKPQSGTSPFYPKRGPDDSELDLDKPLREQFNLLRTVDNEMYPAFLNLMDKPLLSKLKSRWMASGFCRCRYW